MVVSLYPGLVQILHASQPSYRFLFGLSRLSFGLRLDNRDFSPIVPPSLVLFLSRREICPLLHLFYLASSIVPLAPLFSLARNMVRESKTDICLHRHIFPRSIQMPVRRKIPTILTGFDARGKIDRRLLRMDFRGLRRMEVARPTPSKI